MNVSITLNIILLTIIIVLLYIQYYITSNKHTIIETMKNRQGYITKVRKYTRKNILRPLRFKREKVQEYYTNIQRRIRYFLG